MTAPIAIPDVPVAALLAYEGLVAALACGDEVDAAAVADIIGAAGRTFEALGRDVAERDRGGASGPPPGGE